jgi:5-methylcytosine-specific restriction enzyme subunit McrC
VAEIPIQNVYYLLCYAWRQMREGEIAETGAAQKKDVANLLGTVLANGTERVLKQGLDRGYVTQSETTSRPRGQIDFDTSLQRALFPQAKAHCHYDALSRDVLHNRILKSTLRELGQAKGIDEDLQNRLRLLARRFGDVSDVSLRRSLFQRVQLHSGNAFYKFLLRICSLIERNLTPTEGGAGKKFRDFLREEATMWKLFEKFTYHFYRREQERYDVSAPHIDWDVSGDAPEQLPNMRTDVVLSSPGKTIILDTKFSKKVLSEHREKKLFKSENLYQLFAYLQNAETKGGGFEKAEGVLLYPITEPTLDKEIGRFEIRGHRMRVCTVDLNQEWDRIEGDLLSLVGANEGS